MLERVQVPRATRHVLARRAHGGLGTAECARCDGLQRSRHRGVRHSRHERAARRAWELRGLRHARVSAAPFSRSLVKLEGEALALVLRGTGRASCQATTTTTTPRRADLHRDDCRMGGGA